MRNCIGIRNESKLKSERRAPLSPDQVKQVVEEYDMRVIVEPSDRRVFTEEQYLAAGAEISDDLTPCNIIFGIKEVPVPELNSNQAYCFFSHTIKGQSYNMSMLRSILDQHITLFDYELVKDTNGRRTIFFGNFAGYAGMIDSLWALGERLWAEGHHSPFEKIKPAHAYDSLAAAEAAIAEVGEEIRSEGLPKSISPFVCGFLGNGQVSKGAQKIYQLLPVKEIRPTELAQVSASDGNNSQLFMVVFEEQHMVRRIDGGAFDLQEYYQEPEHYEAVFEKHLEHLHMVVNGIYWEPKYPRMITRNRLQDLFSNPDQLPKLRVIGDITCDIDGSIASTVKSTEADNPIYVYDPEKHLAIDGAKGSGPVVMAVDILPAELPREASAFFGKCLMPHLRQLAGCDYKKEAAELPLQKPFKDALIAHHGKLTDNFAYLQEFLDGRSAD